MNVRTTRPVGMMNSTNRDGKLYCLATTTLHVKYYSTFVFDDYTTNFFLTTPPSEFTTCRRQHGCNRRPGKYRKAGTRDKKTTIYMHGFKTVIDFCQLVPMRDILVHLHFSLQVIWQRKVSVRPALSVEVLCSRF